MFAKFSTTSSPLKLLQVGECGRVTRITTSDPHLAQKLASAGLSPGNLAILEQRFPRFLVRVGAQQIALSEPEIQAVSVRLAANCAIAS